MNLKLMKTSPKNTYLFTNNYPRATLFEKLTYITFFYYFIYFLQLILDLE